jgi:hypothetical protein
VTLTEDQKVGLDVGSTKVPTTPGAIFGDIAGEAQVGDSVTLTEDPNVGLDVGSTIVPEGGIFGEAAGVPTMPGAIFGDIAGEAQVGDSVTLT